MVMYRRRLKPLLACLLWACGPVPEPQPVTPPAPSMPMPAPPTAKPAAPASGAPWTTALLVDHPLVGRIYRPADGVFVARSELERDVRQARFVLLGEKHDNPDHHRLQAELFDVMLAAGRRPALVMEMLDTEVQPALDRFRATDSRDADALGRAVDWNEAGWQWPFYRPLLERALQRGLPIAAANLSRARARTIIGAGRAAEALKDLQLAELSASQHAALAEEIRQSHCGMLPEALVGGMVLAQRARDALMGAVLRRAAEAADGALLIAGGGHVRADRGAPLSLDVPRAELAVVSFVEVVAGADDPATYLDDARGHRAYDYLWFTPRLDDDDPCEKLRGRFGKTAAKE